MAASARNPVDKTTWSQMAKRCLACAEYYENQHWRSMVRPRRAIEGHIDVGLRPAVAT